MKMPLLKVRKSSPDLINPKLFITHGWFQIRTVFFLSQISLFRVVKETRISLKTLKQWKNKTILKLFFFLMLDYNSVNIILMWQMQIHKSWNISSNSRCSALWNVCCTHQDCDGDIFATHCAVLILCETDVWTLAGPHQNCNVTPNVQKHLGKF